jgi:hypothetical protein
METSVLRFYFSVKLLIWPGILRIEDWGLLLTIYKSRYRNPFPFILVEFKLGFNIDEKKFLTKFGIDFFFNGGGVFQEICFTL